MSQLYFFLVFFNLGIDPWVIITFFSYINLNYYYYIMKKIYYKNLNSKQQTIAIEKLIRATKKAQDTFEQWEKIYSDEQSNAYVDKESLDSTLDLLNRYRTQYATYLNALNVMGVSRFDI